MEGGNVQGGGRGDSVDWAIVVTVVREVVCDRDSSHGRNVEVPRSLRLGRRGLGLYRDARSKCSECFSATPAMADIPTSTIRKDAHETIGDNANTDKNPIPL